MVQAQKLLILLSGRQPDWIGLELYSLASGTQIGLKHADWIKNANPMPTSGMTIP